MSRFLSTLSLRRATANWFDLWGWAEYFYPRSPCGERRRKYTKSKEYYFYFYPRSPCGERRARLLVCFLGVSISIHALLAESDTWARGSRVTYVISIHALLAESDTTDMAKRLIEFRFLSTLSLRRATPMDVPQYQILDISIHALLAESDAFIHSKHS